MICRLCAVQVRSARAALSSWKDRPTWSACRPQAKKAGRRIGGSVAPLAAASVRLSLPAIYARVSRVVVHTAQYACVRACVRATLESVGPLTLPPSSELRPPARLSSVDRRALSFLSPPSPPPPPPRSRDDVTEGHVTGSAAAGSEPVCRWRPRRRRRLVGGWSGP